MKDIYLEITFRKGKALAAYIYLSKKSNSHVNKSRKLSEGIVADFDDDESIIGLEITAPNKINILKINTVLSNYNIQLSEQELAPLKVA
jgi:uncharacterized protein YuzE